MNNRSEHYIVKVIKINGNEAFKNDIAEYIDFSITNYKGILYLALWELTTFFV